MLPSRSLALLGSAALLLASLASRAGAQPAEFLEARHAAYEEIEAWIADMRPKPSKSAAIRELIVEGLKTIKAEKPEKPAKDNKKR